MNFMYQTYNEIDIQQNTNAITIHLKVKKSVFKHLMIPFVLICILFLSIGLSSLFNALIHDTEGIFILIIWNSLAVYFTYKTLTECLWLLYGKEKIGIHSTQFILEKIYPLRYFQKNYVQIHTLEIQKIIDIRYQFWTQPTANLNLPKLQDGQILIETEHENFYFGMNLTETEVNKIMIAIQHHLQKNT